MQILWDVGARRDDECGKGWIRTGDKVRVWHVLYWTNSLANSISMNHLPLVETHYSFCVQLRVIFLLSQGASLPFIQPQDLNKSWLVPLKQLILRCLVNLFMTRVMNQSCAPNYWQDASWLRAKQIGDIIPEHVCVVTSFLPGNPPQETNCATSCPLLW